MHIRCLANGEAPTLWALFRDTVHRVNAPDYSEAERHAWAPLDLDPEAWAAKMRTTAPFVAEVGGTIVGYSDLQADGLIDHFFVHHQWQRRGVGQALMGEIERRARRARLPCLRAHVSITARGFFCAQGFVALAEQRIPRRGVMLTNYLMVRQRRGTTDSPGSG